MTALPEDVRLRTVSGEAGPVAFLSGSNSVARSVSTTSARSASGMASKMNCSNLTALGSRGSTACPCSSTNGTGFTAR